jgi:hypothetical protein
MRARNIFIKRNAAGDKYLLASWFLQNFPGAMVYYPQGFGYARFQE